MKVLRYRPDKYVQAPQDYFSLLGLPAQFDLDLAQLKSNARTMQREYHPDRYASHTPREQRLAAQVSAEVNSALATLRDPVRRAVYLLERQGIETNAQTHTERDTQFLMQQMQLREELEEARMDGDAKALDQLAGRVTETYRGAQEAFSNTPAGRGELDSETPLPPDKREALISSVSRMRFYQKLLEELDSARTALAG